MKALVSYEPEFVAHGGPAFNGATLSDVFGERDIDVADVAANGVGVAIMWLHTDMWGVVDIASQDIYATANRPDLLIPWMTAFMRCATFCGECGRVHPLNQECKGDDDPICLCGHHSTEHNYTPSGTGSTFCRHSDDVDKYGHPVGNCGCDEFYPQDDSEPCGGCDAEAGEKCRPSCTAAAALRNQMEDSK